MYACGDGMIGGRRAHKRAFSIDFPSVFMYHIFMRIPNITIWEGKNMLTDRSMNQTVKKLQRLSQTLFDRMFIKVHSITDFDVFETKQALHEIPNAELFQPLAADRKWGGEGVYGWFRFSYTVPQALDGQALFLYSHIDAYEETLWVNGRIHSNYANKFVEGSHGNHYCNRINAKAKAGEKMEFALEAYAWHRVPGCMPLSNEAAESYIYHAGSMDICIRNDMYMEFLFDLNTLLSLRNVLSAGSFRRAQVENAMYEAHLMLLYDPDSCTKEEFDRALTRAHAVLKAELSKKNADSAPYVGLIGHSHMDTAWLWPLRETEKKCARTYANQLNLMEEYPEYKFVQSSAFHTDWIRRDYPELFERIKKAAAEGRYEPNGGVWVECDCNLSGGEYLLRQFVWGQRFTREHFGYTSDAFWLPDTFGYSYAIPQIMKGCNVKYFLTTKMAWNDTNRFPYTTFMWQGLDGTSVLTHLNRTHIGPTPETFQEITCGGDEIREKRASDMRLFSFGKGDGGGGPEFEMLEMARRLENLDGCGKSGYTSVSDFMQRLEKNVKNPSVYAGELYLELHRGTLTSQAQIKKNNRDLEIALHNLELITVLDAVKNGNKADGSSIAPLMNTLLVNQFHDILPGTSIHEVNEESRKSTGCAIEASRKLAEALLTKDASGEYITLLNTTSFERRETVHIPALINGAEGVYTQEYTDIGGRRMLAVYGCHLPPFGSAVLKEGKPLFAEAPFTVSGNEIITPFAKAVFNENGAIASFIERSSGRELVSGLPFNTFMMAEDMPADWDNWDIDADAEEKLAPAGKLLSREIVSVGEVEMRIRFVWALSEKSVITQDIVFDAHSPLVTFETSLSWQDDHRLLKAAFDTSLLADGVRNEIQFGYIRRSNHRSTDQEKARFEICNHKYSDLGENGSGIALFNDGKYGLSVKEGSMRLSLHRGGLRPDEMGDRGVNEFKYAIYPHGAFGAESVIQPAYAFNYEPVVVRGKTEILPLAQTDKKNVVIETVKPCEDAEKAYILRMYEAAGDWTKTRLTFVRPPVSVIECNMLEDEIEKADCENLVFEPFRIRTFKVVYE